MSKMKWNYFISHAHEDKSLVASPLAYALKLYGFDVWYDEFALSLGDPLLQSIDNGLANSEFGIVILSKNFLLKEWTQREMAGLLGKERGGKKVILPVWHNISVVDLVEMSPLLADKIGVSTDKGTQYVLEQIIRASYPDKLSSIRKNIYRIPDVGTVNLIQSQLKHLIEESSPSEDIKLLITAHQWLLKNFDVHEGNLISAYKVGAEDLCDFVVVYASGITGPMGVKLIKLGSPLVSKEDLIDYFRVESDNIKNQLGKQFELDEHRSNDYTRKPYVGEYERTLAIAHNVRMFAQEMGKQMENIHWEAPQFWSFRILLVAGRRDVEKAAARDAVARKHSIGLGIASYDRFFDEIDYW